MNTTTSNLKIKCILCFFILLNISCVDTENQSPKSTTDLFEDFHLKTSKTHEIEIKIITSKKISEKYSGILYKVENTSKMYLGIIDSNKKIIIVKQLKGKEAVSLFDNEYCVISYDKETKSIISEDEDCFTFFAGELPYQGYSSIKLEWNCSEANAVSEKLHEGKYFFFFKKGLEHLICNIQIENEKSQTISIPYNTKNGFPKELPNTTIDN